MSALTTPDHWDAYWDKVALPVAVAPGKATSPTEILRVIDRFASSASPLSVLEIAVRRADIWFIYGEPSDTMSASWTTHRPGLSYRVRTSSCSGYQARVLERDVFAPDEPD